MKKEYDFSKAEKGKFYVPIEKIKIPIYLDKKVQSHYLKLTQDKKIDLQTLINITLKKQMSLGLQSKDVFVLGKKNETFIQKLNKQENLFDNIHALEHPRYIQQYKSKEKLHYIDKYIITLNQKN